MVRWWSGFRRSFRWFGCMCISDLTPCSTHVPYRRALLLLVQNSINYCRVLIVWQEKKPNCLIFWQHGNQTTIPSQLSIQSCFSTITIFKLNGQFFSQKWAGVQCETGRRGRRKCSHINRKAVGSGTSHHPSFPTTWLPYKDYRLPLPLPSNISI